MFEQYDAVKALKEPDLYLIKDCSSGMLAVRKRTRTELLSVYGQMSDLDINGIPRIFSIEQDGQYLSIIREYIPGKTLAEALREGVRFSEKEATEKIIALCDILSVVHGLTPPIIHRDIKPSNIILKEDGGICLIDFDAARQYKGDGGGDTHHIGTHGYAAPEQYGFGETDARADIYAVGILLKELLGESISPHLNEIIAACTRMDPAYRYQSAAALKKALSARKLPVKKTISAAAAVLALAAAILAVSHGTADMPADADIPAASNVTPVPTPEQTPELTPVPTPNPWLDIIWPAENPYRTEYPVSDYAALKEILNHILENPNQLYMVIISGDITATEDITIPTNTKLYINPVSALRMSPGTMLVNNGSIQIARGGDNYGMLQLMDNSTLYCMSRKTQGYREMTVDGILDCGSNVTISRETHIGQDGQYPLIHLQPKSILRCADESTLHISGYRYVFIDSRAEFPTAPFIDEEGKVGSADIRITDISTIDELKAAIDAAKNQYPQFTCAIDIARSMTISEEITIPDNASLKLFSEGLTLTVADGGKLTIGATNAQLEDDTSIRVLKGGTLHYKCDNISLAGGSRVYADNGGSIICDHKEVAEKIHLNG